MERTSEEIRQEMNQVRHSISMLENTWIALQKDYLDAHRKEMEAEVRKDFEEERGKN
jgi:hypothetical protein